MTRSAGIQRLGQLRECLDRQTAELHWARAVVSGVADWERRARAVLARQRQLLMAAFRGGTRGRWSCAWCNAAWEAHTATCPVADNLRRIGELVGPPLGRMTGEPPGGPLPEADRIPEGTEANGSHAVPEGAGSTQAPGGANGTDPIPRQPRGHGRKKLWAAIELDYVQGTEIDGELVFPTQAQLVEKYGVSPRALAEHAKRGGWVAKRERYAQKIAVDRHRARQRALLKELDQCDQGARAGAKLAISEMLHHLQEIRAARLRAEAEGRRSLALLQSLEGCMRVLERAHKVWRLALNQPTELVERAAEAERRDQARRHEVYDFLSPEEAGRLAELEARVERGELDITLLYEGIAEIFRRERVVNERRMLGPNPEAP